MNVIYQEQHQVFGAGDYNFVSKTAGCLVTSDILILKSKQNTTLELSLKLLRGHIQEATDSSLNFITAADCFAQTQRKLTLKSTKSFQFP